MTSTCSTPSRVCASLPEQHPDQPAPGRRPTRIAQLSDLHLGADIDLPRQAAALAAFRELEASLPAWDLDLVIVTGDLITDDPDDARDHWFARRLLETLDLPVWTVPGNHDVGDHAQRAGLPADWHGAPVTSDRVRAWRAIWGQPYWKRVIPGWTLLGLNSQVMGSGLVEEAHQWTWLHREAHAQRQYRPSAPVAIFMHEGVVTPHLRTPRDAWMQVPTDAGALLLDTVAGIDLRLIAAGHTHRYAHERRDGIWHVTAPSLSGPIPFRPDMLQPTGLREAGALVYTFGPHGFTVDFMPTADPRGERVAVSRR